MPPAGAGNGTFRNRVRDCHRLLAQRAGCSGRLRRTDIEQPLSYSSAARVPLSGAASPTPCWHCIPRQCWLAARACCLQALAGVPQPTPRHTRVSKCSADPPARVRISKQKPHVHRRHKAHCCTQLLRAPVLVCVHTHSSHRPARQKLSRAPTALSKKAPTPTMGAASPTPLA